MLFRSELTQVEKGKEQTLNLYTRKEIAHTKRERNHCPHSVGIHSTQMNRGAQPPWFNDEPQGKTTTIFGKCHNVKEDTVNNALGRLQPTISGQNNSAHDPLYMGKKKRNSLNYPRNPSLHTTMDIPQTICSLKNGGEKTPKTLRSPYDEHHRLAIGEKRGRGEPPNKGMCNF